MSFATLEEAWGVPSFAGGVKPVHPPTVPTPVMQRHRKIRPPKKSAAAAVEPQRPEFIATHDDTELQNVQRGIARAYARFGPGFVAKLLPAAARHDLGIHHSGKRRRNRFGQWVRSLLRRPETLLVVLLVVFGAVWLWDSVSSSRAATPSLASLHMTPFSLGTSA